MQTRISKMTRSEIYAKALDDRFYSYYAGLKPVQNSSAVKPQMTQILPLSIATQTPSRVALNATMTGGAGQYVTTVRDDSNLDGILDTIVSAAQKFGTAAVSIYSVQGQIAQAKAKAEAAKYGDTPTQATNAAQGTGEVLNRYMPFIIGAAAIIGLGLIARR